MIRLTKSWHYLLIDNNTTESTLWSWKLKSVISLLYLGSQANAKAGSNGKRNWWFYTAWFHQPISSTLEIVKRKKSLNGLEAALFDRRLLLIRGKLKEMFCDIFFNTRHSLPLTGNPVGPYKQFEHWSRVKSKSRFCTRIPNLKYYFLFQHSATLKVIFE